MLYTTFGVFDKCGTTFAQIR